MLLFLTGCNTAKYKYIKHIVYKPREGSFAYRITFPDSCYLKRIVSGGSASMYFFGCHTAELCISDYDSYKSYALHNALLAEYREMLKGNNVTCKIADTVFQSGEENGTFWKYRVVYDFLQNDPKYGFRHLYTGYEGAEAKDTAALNTFLTSPVLLEDYHWSIDPTNAKLLRGERKNSKKVLKSDFVHIRIRRIVH